ncbi:MAG: DUF1579 domain-containing protein [Methylococcales bacterium]
MSEPSVRLNFNERFLQIAFNFYKEDTMRIVPLTLITLCAVLMTSIAFAKDKQAEQPMDPQAMMELYTKLATPGEPHKLFAGLAGSWTTKTREWMEPGIAPVESTGTAEMKMLLDGRFLQQEWNGQMMGQPYTGIGISAYDNIRKRYVSTWMDTMGTGIFIMEGTASADGKTITLNGQHAEPGGGQMTHRAIWKIVDNNTQTFELYGAHYGGKEMKMMEIIYTRKP